RLQPAIDEADELDHRVVPGRDGVIAAIRAAGHIGVVVGELALALASAPVIDARQELLRTPRGLGAAGFQEVLGDDPSIAALLDGRSEERRVGKECRAGWG